MVVLLVVALREVHPIKKKNANLHYKKHHFLQAEYLKNHAVHKVNYAL